MIRMIAKLLKVLNSDAEPGQISMAFCFAMVMGFTPLFSLHNIFVLLLVLLLRTNLSGFILSLLFFSGFAYILDPLFHAIGLKILTLSSLNGLWTVLYNTTIWRLAHFNNTIVMGSLFTSIILFVPLYFLSNFLIRKYRTHILEWVQKTKIVGIIKTSRLYHVYSMLSSAGGQS